MLLGAVSYPRTNAPLLAQQTGRPNFVVVMADDMGYGDAGCYGQTRYATPAVDRLAAEGLRFTDFHSSGSVCSPTRAGLLTGRYQQRAGIPGVIAAAPSRGLRNDGLQAIENTFAELLRKAGYATGMFGKWHLGYLPRYNPTHQGFDRYVGYVSGNVDFQTHIDQAGFHDWWHQAELTPEDGYSTHLITQHAVDFIKSCADQPFCIYIAHEAPHYPYQGPNDPPIRKEGETKSLWNDREPAHAARAYAEMMAEMDRGVGDVLDVLESLGLSEKTLVLFFSDNGATGPGSCGELYGAKGTLWEGGHRVPGIARWTGRINAGTTTDQLAFTIDVMPTLLDLAGVGAPESRPLDGVSLAPLLLKQQELGVRQLFWQSGNTVCMRDGGWKLILNGGKGRPDSEKLPHINWDRPNDGRAKAALFQLNDDPGERRNRVKEYPDRVSMMRAAILAWQQDVEQDATVQPSQP